jgi:nucleoside 2-deoxyribosyltransferase
MIYLAGKVGGDKWKLFSREQIQKYNIQSSDGGNHSEHEFGMALWSWDCCNDDYKWYVQEFCIDTIKKFDFFIAYLDSRHSYGSIAEIAYASACNKECFVFVIDDNPYYDAHHQWNDTNQSQGSMFDTYWFVCSFPNVKVKLCVSFESAQEQAQEVLKKWLKEHGREWYSNYLLSDEWRKLREQAVQRAGYKCQMCNSNGELHVHHRTYQTFNTDSVINDLIVLCKNCHEQFHRKTA